MPLLMHTPNETQRTSRSVAVVLVEDKFQREIRGYGPYGPIRRGDRFVGGLQALPRLAKSRSQTIRRLNATEVQNYDE